MPSPVLTRGLTRRFGDVLAVDGLDLDVPSGEVYGLLGLNGAGKTTTVRMLSGMLDPTAGSATVLGMPVEERRRELARRVGVVFGENRVPEPAFTPLRYLRYFGSMHGLDRSTVDERAKELFETLDFAAYAQRPIGALSTGNGRKTELARALVHKPRVLFLDEPTRGLDIPSKRALWSFLRGFVEDGERTIFLSSHDTEEISTLCDRIGILREGRKTWEGAPEELAEDGSKLSGALSDRLQGKQATFKPVSA